MLIFEQEQNGAGWIIRKPKDLLNRANWPIGDSPNVAQSLKKDMKIWKNGVAIADVVDPYNYTGELYDFEKVFLGVGFSTVPWGVGDIILTCFWVDDRKNEETFSQTLSSGEY